jgi:hypothetical protein
MSKRNSIFAHENMKKTPQKVAEIPSFQKFSFYSPMAEFMFPKLAYRANVYRL